MRRREHKMPRTVDKRTFLDGIRAPEQEHQMLARGSEMRNHGVGKRFPTMTLCEAASWARTVSVG